MVQCIQSTSGLGGPHEHGMFAVSVVSQQQHGGVSVESQPRPCRPLRDDVLLAPSGLADFSSVGFRPPEPELVRLSFVTGSLHHKDLSVL